MPIPPGGPLGGGGISAPGLGQRRPEPEPVCPPPSGKSRDQGPGRDCSPAQVPGLGSGRGAPSPPCLDGDPRPRIPPKSGPERAEFLRFFGACGATSRGGGGAPPTTLILLRNQRQTRASDRRTGAGAPPGAFRAGLVLPGAKKSKKFSFFLRKVVFVSGWTNGGVAIGCADVAVGGGRGRRLPQWLSSARLGVGPYRARSPRLGRSPALAVSQPTGGRGRHSEGSGRVWLSQTASPSPHLRHPCAGLPSLALREVLFRMATYPPPALKRRWRVPSQPCSLTAPAHV